MAPITPPPLGHSGSTVPGEEGTVSGDQVCAAVGLGTSPTHPTGAFAFPGRGCNSRWEREGVLWALTSR